MYIHANNDQITVSKYLRFILDNTYVHLMISLYINYQHIEPFCKKHIWID